MTNPITQAVEALDDTHPGHARVNATVALAALDHEAATEEWRCPDCSEINGPISDGRCDVCADAVGVDVPVVRGYWVPFREDDHD